MTDLAGIERTLADADRAAIADAMLTAFPDLESLYALLNAKWGVTVSNFIYTGGAGTLVIADLIAWAHAQGRTLELLSVTWTEKHRQHRPLQLLADKFLPAPADELRKYAVGMANEHDEALGLKAALGGASPPRAFANDRLPALVGAVCVVSVGGRPTATGFLIGRQTVLTAYHAVAHVVDGDLSDADVRLHFDRRCDVTESAVAAAPGAAWLGPYSESSASDRSRDGAVEPGKLDFAVIRLAAPVSTERTILSLPDAVPIVVPGDAMTILQHPLAGTLQIAQGELIGYTVEGERLHYLANTAPGSAGAPVLDSAGRLIAMHHAAQQQGAQQVAQGVPIWPIRQAIVAAGFDLGNA